MKNQRQIKILEIIENEAIQTQELLVKRLNESGYPATQATICRDIKELKLHKAVNKSGDSIYTAPVIASDSSHDKLIRILRASFLSINISCNIAVIKTLPATASAVASAVDNLKFPNLLGTIAGDDTIFACFATEQDALTFYNDILHELR